MSQKARNTGSKSSTRKLLEENQLLSEQVKRLVKTEYALYNTQIELDKQISLYRTLYDIGKILSQATEKTVVFSEMDSFIIDELNYGGYLLLEKNASFYCLIQPGGCCKSNTDIASLKPITQQQMRRLLNSIRDANNNYIVTNSTTDNKLIKEFCSESGFIEFAIFDLITGQDKIPSYILVVGNPGQNEFYNRIIPYDMRMIGLGNFVSLAVNTLKNLIHYQQLIEERKLLKKKVRERTYDLKDALQKLKKLNKKLSYLSLNDELTELLNRRGFFINGNQCFESAKRNGTSLLLLYCDMDKLKTINDVYGHQEGDVAIKQLALIFKKVFRKVDILCRYGGDEFIILLENSHEAYYSRVKNRMEKALHAYNSNSEKEYELSVSIGFASYTGTMADNLSFLEFIGQADKKLYEEKERKKRLPGTQVTAS